MEFSIAPSQWVNVMRNRAFYKRQPPEKCGVIDAARLLNVDPAEFQRLSTQADFPRPAIEQGEPNWFTNELMDWQAHKQFRRTITGAGS